MSMSYHENFADALPEMARVKEEKKRLEAAGVKYILSCWIYGCDICQEVCPWNIKFARKSNENSFAHQQEIVKRTKVEWLALTEDEYRRTFRNSAVKRAKFKGLKRNISACNQE